MDKHILITGGAGFIGSHLVDAMLARGYRVSILDNLSPQVHADGEMDAEGWPTGASAGASRGASAAASTARTDPTASAPVRATDDTHTPA